MEWPPVTDLQMWAKHSGYRSQYLHTVKKATTELYKLNSEDPRACAGRVEYLQEEDRFICLPGSYEVSFSHLSVVLITGRGGVGLDSPGPPLHGAGEGIFG